MAHLKKSPCAYNIKLSLNELSIVILSKKKSFQTTLKSRNGFRVFDMIR